MRLNKIRKIIVIVQFVSIILSFFFVLININHDCIHNDCEACSLIYKFNYYLKGFNPNLLKLVILILVLFHLKYICLYVRLINKKDETLVGLNVRLNS